jgi:hypothetical protein
MVVEPRGYQIDGASSWAIIYHKNESHTLHKLVSVHPFQKLVIP